MDLANLASKADVKSSAKKENSYSFPRENEELGTSAEFDIATDPLPVDKIQELLGKGVQCKSKEVYATLTLPKGSIKLNGVVLNKLRGQVMFFADAS